MTSKACARDPVSQNTKARPGDSPYQTLCKSRPLGDRRRDLTATAQELAALQRLFSPTDWRRSQT